MAGAEFVDFVQHDDRVHDFDILQGLDKFTRHGADIGTAMALDFSFVTHAADTETVEGTAQTLGDRAADTGFAHTGRPDQQDDRAADRTFIGTQGQKLQNTCLDVIQAIVIMVQYLAGTGNIQLVRVHQAPGYGSNPVQVVAGDGILG